MIPQSSGVSSVFFKRLLVVLVAFCLLAAFAAPRFARAQGGGDELEIATQKAISGAEISLEKGAFDKALFQARGALKLQPENVAALKLFAEITAVWQPKRYKKEREESLKKANLKETPELVRFGQMLEAREFDKAIEALKTAVRQNPDSDRKSLYYLLIGYAYGGKGEADKAASQFRTAIGWRKGEFVQAYADLSAYYLSQGRVNEAWVALQPLAQIDPQNDRWFIASLEYRVAAGQTSPVINVLVPRLEKVESPEFPDIVAAAYSVLGRAYFQRNQAGDAQKGIKSDRELAIQALENAAKVDLFHTQSLVFLADHYFEQGDFDKAISTCEQVLQREPEHPNALYQKGLLYALKTQPDFDKSVAAFKKIVDSSGKPEDISLLGQGHAALLKPDAAAAYAFYSQLLKQQEEKGVHNQPLVELFTGLAALATGNVDDAKKHLGQIEQVRPETLFKLKADEYLQALAIAPPADMAPLLRAVILSNEGRNQLAEKAWETTLAKFPDSLIARQQLFLLYLRNKENVKKAEELANVIRQEYDKRFQKRNPTGALTQVQILGVKMNQEENVPAKRAYREQLIAAYEDIKKTYPDHAESYRALAQLYLDRGQDDGASKVAREGLDKFTTDRQLFSLYVTALARLDQNDTIVKAFDEMLKRLREKGESVIGLQYSLALSYERQGNPQKVVDQLKALLGAIDEESKNDAEKKKQLQKDNIGAIDMTRRYAVNVGDMALALFANDILASIDGEWPGIALVRGLDNFDRGDWQKAIDSFDAEIKFDRLDGYRVMAEAGKGLALLKLQGLNKIDDVKNAYSRADKIADYLVEQDKALSGNPAGGSNFSIMKDNIKFYKACAMLANKEVEQAERTLTLCPSLFYAPPDPMRSPNMTTAFDKILLVKFLEALKNNDNFFDLAAGAFNRMRGFFGKAVTHFDKELAVNPDNFIALYFKGLALLAQQDSKSKAEGIAALKQCIALQKSFIPARFQLYLALIAEQKEAKEPEVQQALRAEIVSNLQELIALEKRFKFNLAQYYEGDKDYKNAIKMYLQCTEWPYPYNTDIWVFYNQAAWIAAENLDGEQDLKSAIEYAQSSIKELDLKIERSQKNENEKRGYISRRGSVRDTLGWAYYKLALKTKDETAKKNNLKEAETAFLASLKDLEESGLGQTGSTPTILSHLADALLAEGKKPEALKNYLDADDYLNFNEKDHVKEQIKKLKDEGVTIKENG